MASKRASSSRKSTRESAFHVEVDESSSMGQPSPNVSMNSSNTTILSRQQEKQELSHLNNRLAAYIEHVRALQTENDHLSVRIREEEVVYRKEKADMISNYEKKIEETRNRMDQLTGQLARAEIERAKAIANEADLKSRVAELDKKYKVAENNLRNALKTAQDYSARATNAENANQLLEKDNATLGQEAAALRKQNNTLQKQLEDEVVLRTELENKLKTLKDDLDFARSNHSAQLDDFHRKRQIEMTSYSAEVENRYKAQLQEQLQSMRDDFDRRIAQSRAEHESMLSKYDSEVTKLTARIKELERILRDQEDVKMQLVTELQAYHKLLEGEEHRLRLTPKTSPNASDSMGGEQRRGTKRKHVDVDFSHITKNIREAGDSTGPILIDDVDYDGQYIRLLNNSDEDVALGGYYLKSTANDKEVTFKFHSRQQLKAGKTITVWSNDAGKETTSPTDTVMKNQKWPTGVAVRVEVLLPNEEVCAWREAVYEGGFSHHLKNGGANGERPECCLM